MKVHHLNLGTLSPPGSLLTGYPETLTCHALAVETRAGLVLVDTGFGLEDVARPRDRLGRTYLSTIRPRLDPEETAARQIVRLGFRRGDVRHVVLTHLDADHAGGLADFPTATVHVHGPELRGARERRTLLERHRYRPRQLAHGPRLCVHDVPGERWRGLQTVQTPGLPEGLLLVPLRGHTRGHCGVAVDADGGWLLHCGDAMLLDAELEGDLGRAARAIALYHRVEDHDPEAARASQERLRAFAREHRDVRLLCSHDADGFARACRRAA